MQHNPDVTPCADPRSGRGFTVLEMLVVVLVVIVTIGIMLPAAGGSRCTGSRKVVSQSNMRSLGGTMANHAADHNDWFATLPSDPDVARRDTVRILAALTGRSVQYGGHQQLLPLAEDFQPEVRYQHLPLMEYLTAQLPEQILASPYDRSLMEWQEDPVAAVSMGMVPFAAGTDADFPELSTPSARQLWPYGSSYQWVPAIWNPDNNAGATKSWMPLASTMHRVVRSADAAAPHGQRRRFAEVAFPSSKVMAYEEFDWMHKNGPIWSHQDNAKVNALFADGSVRSVAAEDFNPGATPDGEATGTFTQALQRLDTYPPKLRSQSRSGTALLRFRWTRGGLSGIDLGGQEVSQVP